MITTWRCNIACPPLGSICTRMQALLSCRHHPHRQRLHQHTGYTLNGTTSKHVQPVKWGCGGSLLRQHVFTATARGSGCSCCCCNSCTRCHRDTAAHQRVCTGCAQRYPQRHFPFLAGAQPLMPGTRPAKQNQATASPSQCDTGRIIRAQSQNTTAATHSQSLEPCTRQDCKHVSVITSRPTCHTTRSQGLAAGLLDAMQGRSAVLLHPPPAAPSPLTAGTGVGKRPMWMSSLGLHDGVAA